MDLDKQKKKKKTIGIAARLAVAAGLLLALTANSHAQSCPATPEGFDILLFLDNSGSIDNVEYDSAQQAVAAVAQTLLGGGNPHNHRLAVVNWACSVPGGGSRDGCRIDLATGSAVAGGWSTNPADFAYVGNNSAGNKVCRSFGVVNPVTTRNQCGGGNFTHMVGLDYAQHALKILEAALYSGGGTGGNDSYNQPTVRPGPPSTRRLMILHMTDAAAQPNSSSLIREVPLSELALGNYYYSNRLKNVRNALIVGVGIDLTASIPVARQQLGALASRGGASTDYDTVHQTATSTQAFDVGAPRLATFSPLFTAAGITEAVDAALADTVPACLTVRKTSVGAVGSFDFTGGTNGLPASLSLTTASPDTPVSSAAYVLTHYANSSATTSITETIPSGWDLTGIACVDAASNPVPGIATNLTTGQLTIPAAQVTSGAELTCTFTNTRVAQAADLAITKDDGSDTYTPGADVVYTIVVSNNGPFGAQNAHVQDALPAGITTASWTCVAANGAVCHTASGSGAIDALVDLPFNASGPGATATLTLTMAVPAGFTGDLVNTATVTPGDGTTDPDLTNNTDTDTNTPNLQPDFGTCDARMFLSEGAVTNLWEVGTATNPFGLSMLGTGSIRYNGMGYNPADNYLYAMRYNAPSNDLLRLGSDGSTLNLGPVSGLPALYYNSGAVSPAGVYYVRGTPTGSGASNMLYAIDLTARTATTITLDTAITTSDIAFVGSTLYTVTDSGQLYSIDVTTGSVTAIGSPVGGMVFGAQYGASNGLFGAANSGAGFFRIDLLTGARTLVSAGPMGSNTDGANCPAAEITFEADLWVTKTNTPAAGPSDQADDVLLSGTQTTYQIVVGNDGPFPVDGALLKDAPGAGLTDCALTPPVCTASGTATCPAAGTGPGELSIDNLQGDGVPIPLLGSGGRVTINLTCTVE